MKKSMIVIINILLLSSCEWFMDHFGDSEWSIRIKNNSSQTVYAYADYILPDTVLPIDRPKYLIEISFGEKYPASIYDEYVNDPKFKRLKKDRITLFILSKDSVDIHPWTYIRTNNVILKRYEFNEQELLIMGGWQINYP